MGIEASLTDPRPAVVTLEADSDIARTQGFPRPLESAWFSRVTPRSFSMMTPMAPSLTTV
jgi:hypothetical protein